MIQIVNKNEGPKIAVEVSGTKIFFGDDELMLNAARYQRDYLVQVDVCMNRDQQLVLGTGEGLYYVAQVEIPAKQYTHIEEGDEGSAPVAIPLSIDDCICCLWSLDNPTPVPVE